MSASSPTSTEATRVATLIRGFYGSAAVFAASEVGIFGELTRVRASDAAGIADALGLNLKGTTLLLDACVALGLLEKEGLSYRNSLEAETYLVPGGPGELFDLIQAGRDAYSLWTSLPDFVRSGAPIDCRSVRDLDSESLAAHLVHLHARSLVLGRPIIRRLDLHGRRTLLEVGGAAGAYSVLATQEFPQLHCTVVDRPEVVKVAAAFIAQKGASSRVSTLAGDYYSMSFPPGNDIVLLFGVMQQAPSPANLIREAAESLNPGGVVYVMDVMTDESRTMPPFSALLALHVALTSQRGRVFSHVDLQNWMQAAGLCGFAAEALPRPLPEWLTHGRKPA